MPKRANFISCGVFSFLFFGVTVKKTLWLKTTIYYFSLFCRLTRLSVGRSCAPRVRSPMWLRSLRTWLGLERSIQPLHSGASVCVVCLQSGALLSFLTVWRLASRREEVVMGFLREKPGTGPGSVLPQSLDESKSQGQLRFEG